jgi:mono/diheme cytochrome c family protein
MTPNSGQWPVASSQCRQTLDNRRPSVARADESPTPTQKPPYWPLATGHWPLRCTALALLITLAGCKRQAKFKPQGMTGLFADGRDSRRPPEGIVARGHLAEDTPYYTGMEGAMYTGKNPERITMELLKKGQAKFNTYCSPCHDRTGTGQGIVPQHAPGWQPANLMDDRIVQFADGEIFHVVTNGRRSMPAYRFQVAVEDRWAIIAYLRGLQRAATGSLNDVPAEMRTDLK